MRAPPQRTRRPLRHVLTTRHRRTAIFFQTMADSGLARMCARVSPLTHAAARAPMQVALSHALELERDAVLALHHSGCTSRAVGAKCRRAECACSINKAQVLGTPGNWYHVPLEPFSAEWRPAGLDVATKLALLRCEVVRDSLTHLRNRPNRRADPTVRWCSYASP
jgi:hypothetical protein